MRATFTALVVVAICAACLVVSARHANEAGQQSTGLIGATGTAVLSGVVVTDASGSKAIHRATVRITTATGGSSRIVGTDEEGKFRIDGLPAGRFTLSASKLGYVTVFHGSKHPGRGPGVPVAVSDGQLVDVTLKMLPGAAITGVISDPQGNPAAGVAIALVDLRRISGGAAATMRGVTDDRGVYRIYGLPPGDYLVSALPRLVPTNEGRGTSPATGVVSVTDAEVQWARNAATSGIARATPGGTATVPPPGRLVSYAPVYYPGATDVAGATKVSVAAGEERGNVGMMLRIVPMSRIAGTLIDQDGQPLSNASVALYPRRTDQPTAADTLVASGALVLPRATVSPAGFSIPGVAPGDYTIVARTGGMRRGAEPSDATPALWSITDLTVAGTDQTDLVLRLLPGLKLTGSIAFEGASAAPADASGIDLTLIQTGSSIGTFTTPRAVIDPRGVFQFTSVAPGAYALSAGLARLTNGSRWTLKSAMLNERDLADGAFELKPGADINGLALTFTDRAAEISGRLIDSEGRPVTRYSIVVFTVERSLWLANARRIKLVQPATDGSFSTGGLPAGSYAIVAVEDVDAADLSDHTFLSRLLESAFKLTLADGERKTQDLKVR